MKNICVLFFILVTFLLITACGSSDPVEPSTSYSIQTELIPNGTFQMGNTGDYVSFDDKPVHSVTLTKSFYLGKYEVTQAQWKKITGADPSYFKGDSLPVEQVSWFDALDFCNKLSVKDGLTKCYVLNADSTVTCNWEANGWRLPTEAEWEYACKAGVNTDFYNGSLTKETCKELDPTLDKIAWYCSNSDTKTHSVGQKAPNNFGLYDMSGNVFELCWDSNWGSYHPEPLTDPKGSSNILGRIGRGGSFGTQSFFCRSSHRGETSQNNRIAGFGLRVCRNK